MVHGTPGREEIFSIQSLNTSSSAKPLTIVGGRGRKIYEIFPLSNTEVILADFQPVQKNDVIDLSHFSTITKMSDISYSTFPVVLLLPNNQLVELSSYRVFNFTSKAFLFASDTTSSSSTSLSASSILAVVMSLSVSDVLVIGVLVAVTLAVFFSSCIQRDQKRSKRLLSKLRYAPPNAETAVGSSRFVDFEVEKVEECFGLHEVVEDNEEEDQTISLPQLLTPDQRLTTSSSSNSSSSSSSSSSENESEISSSDHKYRARFDEEDSSNISHSFDELSL